MSEIDRLKAAIVAEIREAIEGATETLKDELARVAVERDAALAAAAVSQIVADAERVSREAVEQAYAAYRAQIEELAGQIEAPGTYAGDPEPEPEPEPEPRDAALAVAADAQIVADA